MFRRNRSHTVKTRAADPRALAALIAAGALVGGVATVLLGGAAGLWEPASVARADEAGATTVTTSPEPPASKPAPVAAKPTAPARTSGTPAASKPAPAGAAAKAGTSTGAARSGRRGATPGASPMVQATASLDDQVTYHYNALGRRDPFQSLLGGEYVGADVGGQAPPDVGGIKVVGIVWGDADQFALVEDARGDSHVMRRGDKVMNGFVESLKRDAMIVNLTVDGQSQSVRVPLTRKGDSSNANR